MSVFPGPSRTDKKSVEGGICLVPALQPALRRLVAPQLLRQLAHRQPQERFGQVAARTRQGGHAVAEEVIRRRFRVGWPNFQSRYRPLVDASILYDNIAQGENS